MGRFFITLILGSAIFVVAAWQFGFIFNEDKVSPVKDGAASRSGKSAKEKLKIELGKDLFTPVPWPVKNDIPVETKVDSIQFRGSMAVIDRPDVAAQVAGQILFIGEEVPEGAAQVAGIAPFIAEPFDFARVNHGSREVVKPYRRLYEGQIVYENQILAMIDTAKALGDLDMKRGKVIAAKAESDGAKAIADEAENKLKTATALYSKGAIALEEYRSAVLTRDKMCFDSISKLEAWQLAKIDENVSKIIYKQHEVRNKVPVHRAVIQKIYKQRGEAIKEMDPAVMQLYSLDRLLAEAQIDVENAGRIHDGMRVTVEPTIVESPVKTYRGHVAAVNRLAITNDPVTPLIVSAGEDRTVLIWNRYLQSPIRELKHREAVKALAVSPVGAKRNLVLTGCVDGSLRLYDLAAKENTPIKEDYSRHNVAITALAFSPDGKYFASGAADGSIIVWLTDTFEPAYPLDEKHGSVEQAHGAISSLQFTPQGKLVAASLDNSILVWSLKEKGATLDFEPLAGRSGNVHQIDVSSDGSTLLFDQGKTMQMKSVADGRMINTFQNPGGVIPFETLALFSPDSSLMLTAGASEGRLQLWHTPTASTRGFEIRQFATSERQTVSCAAFAPRLDYQNEGSFAVSANKDGQIYLWTLPSPEDVKNHPIHNVRVRLVSAAINQGTRQISIGVEVPNPASARYPKGRLEPGRPVTIVIDNPIVD